MANVRIVDGIHGLDGGVLEARIGGNGLLGNDVGIYGRIQSQSPATSMTNVEHIGNGDAGSGIDGSDGAGIMGSDGGSGAVLLRRTGTDNIAMGRESGSYIRPQSTTTTDPEDNNIRNASIDQAGFITSPHQVSSPISISHPSSQTAFNHHEPPTTPSSPTTPTSNNIHSRPPSITPHQHQHQHRPTPSPSPSFQFMVSPSTSNSMDEPNNNNNTPRTPRTRPSLLSLSMFNGDTGESNINVVHHQRPKSKPSLLSLISGSGGRQSLDQAQSQQPVPIESVGTVYTGRPPSFEE
ncbi:hypothetical protein HDU76_013794 [Blyttiomyces sp. JEL0837]|nr:hypothetical protein HDU76_013794 [Blyttiomyces sp. JEL0837]